MKPLVKSLYKNVDDGIFYRVIAYGQTSERLILVSMKETREDFRWPFYEDSEFLTQNNNMRLCEVDPFFQNRMTFSEADRLIRDKRVETIEFLIGQEGIFDSQIRNRIIQELSTGEIQIDTGIQSLKRCAIWNSLKQYWMNGMTNNSLLPNFKSCGGRGLSKIEGQKSGRLSSVPGTDGLMTSKMEAKIETAIEKHYVKNAKNSKRDAFIDFIGELTDDEFHPSERQFIYRLNKKAGEEAVRRARMGAKKFDKDERQIYGHSRLHFYGPGSEVLIDSTMDNIRAISSEISGQYIGRLTLYIMFDLACAFPTGIYLTTECPSCDAAFMTILNSGTDKVLLAKEFDLDINENDWPWDFVPGRILADRGELRSNRADIISENLDVDLSLTPPWHPELKSCIERAIRTFQDRLRGLLTEAGGIGPDDGERGVADSRKKAVLTVKEIMQLFIKEAIFFIHHTWVSDYPLTPEMKKEGVEPIPIKLLQWFRSKGYGNLRNIDRKTLWQNLLPREEASFNGNGIRWGDSNEYILSPENLHILKEIKQFKKDAIVAYNPTYFNHTYLLYNNEFYPIFPMNGKTASDRFVYEATNDHYRQLEKLNDRVAIRAEAKKRKEQKVVIDKALSRKVSDVNIKDVREARSIETKKLVKNQANDIDPTFKNFKTRTSNSMSLKKVVTNNGYPE